MTKCTAPVKGHYRATAFDRCPTCGGSGRGGWPRPDSHLSAAGNRARNLTAATLRKSAGPVGAEISAKTVSAALELILSTTDVAILAAAADDLARSAAKKGKGSHWLCELFAEAADALDPSWASEAVGGAFASALVQCGLPDWAARGAGTAIAKATAGALSAASPAEQLYLGLRILGMLICPNTDTCPVQDRLAGGVLQDLLTEASD
ncbi:hypothetical protein GCM10027427_29450 [Pseudoclavibacter terrae]